MEKEEEKEKRGVFTRVIQGLVCRHIDAGPSTPLLMRNPFEARAKRIEKLSFETLTAS